jgi:hypothetical protein
VFEILDIIKVSTNRPEAADFTEQQKDKQESSKVYLTRSYQLHKMVCIFKQWNNSVSNKLGRSGGRPWPVEIFHFKRTEERFKFSSRIS